MNWVSKIEFRNWAEVKSAPEEAKDLIWTYLNSLDPDTREAVLQDDSWYAKFKYVASLGTKDAGLLKNYSRTGIERIWNAYLGKDGFWKGKVMDLLTDLIEAGMPYLSVESAITGAKIEVLKTRGILLAYDRDGNCLVHYAYEQQEHDSEDTGRDST